MFYYSVCIIIIDKSSITDQIITSLARTLLIYEHSLWRAPLDSSIIVGIITSLSTLAGAGIAGLFMYKITIRKEKTYQLYNRLLTAYKDIESFRELEKLYVDEIEKSHKTSKKDSVKRRIWTDLKNNGKNVPSKCSQPAYLSREIERITSVIESIK